MSYQVDLHVHFRRRSGRMQTHVHDAIKAGIDRGLDGLAFTEHHEQLPPEWIQDLRARYPDFGIYNGVEVSCGEDILVYGVYDRGLWQHWKGRWEALHEFVTERGGAMVLAHPFRRRDRFAFSIVTHRLHAIEGYSRNTPPEALGTIAQTARALKIPVVANSDAHRPSHVGEYYSILTALPRDDAQLARLIRAAGIEAG